jgi:anti-sigma factor RsiW
VTSGLAPRCQAARVWISAAVDGEASDAERAALRLHLAECHACRAWAALAESVSLQVRTSAPIEPAGPFAFPEQQPVRRARRSPLRARARVAAFASPLLAAAAVAGVFLSGALQSTPPTTQQHSPRQPVLTVAQVNAEGFVAGSSSPGGWDMRPRDTQQQQAVQVPVPRNRDLPEDAVP